MCSCCLEMEHGAAQTVGVGSGGELERGFIVVKASASPLNGSVVGSQGTDEGREQIDGAVESVEDRPGDSVGENGENIVDSERNLKRVG